MAVIARLRPGVTLEAARRDLDDVRVRIFPIWQSGFQDKNARLTPYALRQTVTGTATRPMALFVAAVALVLLISVANVTSLGLVRSMRRWREIALRSVLGASRGRLVKLVITESVLLAVAGAMMGIAVGWLGLALLQRYATDIPRLDAAHLDARAVAVAFALALLAGLVIGGVPALRLFSADRGDGLRDGTRAVGDSRKTNQLRAAFVTTEFALALPLLAASALLLNSVMRLQSVDTGFDARGLYNVHVALPAVSYREQPQVANFWRRISADIRSIPGVTSAGLASYVPPSTDGDVNNFDLIDHPVPPGGAQPASPWTFVDNAFLEALGLPLLEGRAFTAADTGAVPVVLVTRSWAKRFFPDRSPVGRELISGGCTSCPHTVIIGVVGDASYDGLGASREAIFSPLSEGFPTQLEIMIRSAAPREHIEARVREVIRAADANVSAEPMEAMEDRIYESVAQPRHWATILAAFASAALVMAAVGIFGLLAYAVALRRREIGVRMALGAPVNQVVRSIVGDGMRFAIIGAAIGMALTVLASRWLRGSLYGVSALDPVTLVGAVAAMLLVALIASWIPARRAAAIDPLEAIRPD
jgi:putative ABC transport system permease protein